MLGKRSMLGISSSWPPGLQATTATAKVVLFNSSNTATTISVTTTATTATPITGAGSAGQFLPLLHSCSSL